MWPTGVVHVAALKIMWYMTYKREGCLVYDRAAFWNYVMACGLLEVCVANYWWAAMATGLHCLKVD